MEQLPTFSHEEVAERAADNAEGLKRVIAHFGDGAKMARALSLSKSYIALWEEVPIKFVNLLSKMTGIPPKKILPQPYPFYPEEPHEKAREQEIARQGAKR